MQITRSEGWHDEGAASGDRFVAAPGAEGIERLEAHLHGLAFAPHRHDTYAIGLTVSGVQSFHFRGERWHCLPGQCHLLHPDETHDGAAGNDAGFSYKMVYLDPSLVQDALGGQPLPFVANPIIEAAHLAEGLVQAIWDLDRDLDDDLAKIELVTAVVTLLLGAAVEAGPKARPLALERLSLVRELIGEAPAVRHSLAELERLSGLDRWTLARQFRAAFGISPSRYRTLRQLDEVRCLLKGGAALAEAAIAAGFADQSHMSRQFKLAYGLTPARWAAALA